VEVGSLCPPMISPLSLAVSTATLFCEVRCPGLFANLSALSFLKTATQVRNKFKMYISEKHNFFKKPYKLASPCIRSVHL